MILETILAVFSLLVLLLITGFLSIFFGYILRYLYLIIGSFVPVVNIDYNKPIVVVITFLIAYWMFWNSKNLIKNNMTQSWVVSSTHLAMKSYMYGLLFGSSVALIYYFFQ